MRRTTGLVRQNYSIYTYIKPEYLEKFGSRIQDASRKAVRRIFEMGEDKILAVPEEVVNKALEGVVSKIIYLDKEEHEKWVNFPRPFKRWLHFWLNKMLDTIELQKRDKEPVNTLAFYLFGKTAELYKQGLVSGKTVLSVLEELYEKQDEIQPLRKKEYTQLEKKLDGSVKVLVNFKNKEALRDWYASLPIELKRGVWVKAHEKLLDNLQKIWYNILHQNL